MVDLIDLPTLIYYMGNMAFLCSFGALLSIRALKTGFINVFYFGLAILLNAGFYVANTIYALLGATAWIHGISEICVVASFFPEIAFIKKTFYPGSMRRSIIAATIAYAVLGAASIAAGFLNDAAPANPIPRVVRYAIDDLVLFIIILSWNMLLGARAYKHDAKDANSAVRRRFLYFSLGQGFVIISVIIDFFTAIVAVGSIDVYAPVSLACAVLYAIFMYMTWFPKTRLAGQAGAPMIVGDGNMQRTVNMHVIEHFGKILSGMIGKNASACSGLILVAIESRLGEVGISRMTLKDLENVIGGKLLSRLNALGLPDAAGIVKRLKAEIATNISLFTITMF